MWKTAMFIALLALLPAASCGLREAPEPPQNLLIISLDTVRADHLQTYGYHQQTSPNIDRLAQESVVFQNAFCQDTNTNPSHTSMFTGLYPHVHGSLYNGTKLKKGVTTLAQTLAAAGFQTGAFVSSASMKAEATGLDRGFALYDDHFKVVRLGKETVSEAARWLAGIPQGQRYFLFVHLFDAHGPYIAPEEYAELFETEMPDRTLPFITKYQRLVDEHGDVIYSLNHYINQYDGLIRYLDDAVEQLVEQVDRERTAVVVLSDHGETLGERAWVLDHGGQVYDEQMHIPLIVSAPGVKPMRSEVPAETVDLMRTLTDLLRVPLSETIPQQGVSLAPALKGAPIERSNWVFSGCRVRPQRHADRNYQLRDWHRILSARSATWKLIYYPGVKEDYFELYNLKDDPGETRNVAAEFPDLRHSLFEKLQRWHRVDLQSSQPPEIDVELEEQLRALGYVGD